MDSAGLWQRGVHVFHKESRAYYNLERLWADGKKIEIDDMIDS